jgi:hypothetical protein
VRLGCCGREFQGDGRIYEEAFMSDEKQTSPDATDEHGQSASAEAEIARKADERSAEEQEAASELLKSSGGDPFTQESD